jgi:hypothetical protein
LRYSRGGNIIQPPHPYNLSLSFVAAFCYIFQKLWTCLQIVSNINVIACNGIIRDVPFVLWLSSIWNMTTHGGIYRFMLMLLWTKPNSRELFSLNGYPSMLILSTCLCWPVCFTSRIKAMTNHLPYNCLCCLLKIIALSMYLVKWYTTVLDNYKSNCMQMSWIYPTLTMDKKGITHISVNFA